MESTGGEQLPWRSGSSETTSGRKTGETQAELEGKGGTALLDVEALLWRVLSGVEVQRGGGCTATQRCWAAEQGGGKGFGIWGCGKGEGVVHGRPGWHFKKETEDLGVRVWHGGSPGISAGDRGGVLRARGGCGRREKGPTGGVPAQ